MIDLHCDTIMKLIDYPSNGDLYRNTWKVDIEKLQKAHSKVQDFALFINLGNTNDPYGRYEAMRNLCTSQIHHYGEHIQHVLSYQDVESVYETGKIGALMSIEEGGVLGGDLDKLKQAARLEAYASYSEFVRRTALIEADKVIAEKRLDNKMED